jgi:hypothetical protein
MKKPIFEITGILYEPELHFIPAKYFEMACKLTTFMRENNLREIQGLTLDEYYNDAISKIEETHEIKYNPKHRRI